MKKIHTTIIGPISPFVDDKRKEGWKLIRDVPVVGEPQLKLVPCVRTGDATSNCFASFNRITKLGNPAGQRHLELLEQQKKIIPQEWFKAGLILLFPGTVWEDKYGSRLVSGCYPFAEEWFFCWPGRLTNRSRDRLTSECYWVVCL